MKILKEETPDGKNGWFTARERLGQSTGFLEDISRAWALAEGQARQQLNSGVEIEAVVSLVRLALVRSSLNSIAANIPADLLEQ